MYSKCFLLECGLQFHLLNRVVKKSGFSNYADVFLSIFPSMAHVYTVLRCKMYLPTPKSLKLSAMFSSYSFIISTLHLGVYVFSSCLCMVQRPKFFSFFLF